jgi:hypothetical protein
VTKRVYVIASLCMTVLTGCYDLEPVGTVTPATESRVAFDVTDAGRVALGGSMGPEIDQIEGYLKSADSSTYTVAVTTVRFLRDGGEQKWTGETVRLKREYVSRSYVRTLNKGRTVVVSLAGAAAIAAIVGRSLIPAGDPVVDVPSDTGSQTRRGALPKGGLGRRRLGRPYSPLWFPPHLSRP